MQTAHPNNRSISQTLHEYNDMFNELYQDAKNKLKDKMSTVHDFVSIVVQTMVVLCEQESLHGYQKKEMVLDIAAKLIDDAEATEQEKATLRHYVFYTLGNTIDLFIATAKGYLMLRKAKQKVQVESTKCLHRMHLKTLKKGNKRDVIVGGGGDETTNETTNEMTNDSTNTITMIVPPVDLQQLTDTVYDQLKSMIQNKTVNLSNIVNIASMAMQVIQQYTIVTGSQKKQVVMNVIGRLISEIPMAESDRAILQSVVNVTLDKTIDLIIGIANGDINIMKTIDDGVAWCKKTCCKK